MLSKIVVSVLVAAGCLSVAGCATDPGSGTAVVTEDLAAPTSVTATATSPSRITVSWTAVSGAIKYYIYQSQGPAGPFTLKGAVKTPNTSLPVANLTAGTEYCYVVSSGDMYGNNGPQSSPPACATTPNGATLPPPPTNVVATPTSSSRITVSWSAAPTATKYFVYQSTGMAGPYNYVASVVSPTTSYPAASLTASTQYCFEVASVNSAGTSAVSSPPACGTTFAAGLEGFWKLNEGSGTTAKDSSGLGRDGSLTGSATYVNDRPPMDNDPWAVALAGGTGDAISVPDATPWWFTGDFTLAMWVKVPSAPSGTLMVAGKRASGCGAIDWELSQDTTLKMRGTTTLNFGQTLPVGSWIHVAVTSSGGNAVAYIGGMQVASGPFSIGPRSSSPMEFGNSGNCGGPAVDVDHIQVYSRALTATEIATLGTPPPTPTNFMATAQGATHVNLSWDAVAGASKYFVYKGSSPGSETLFAAITGTTFSDGTNAPASTTYWEVRSVRNTLVSNYSPELSVTTGPAIAAPTGVTATRTSSTRIRVDWMAVTGAVKYYVYQSAAGGAYTLEGSVLAPTVTFTATNLTTGTQYCYELKTVGTDSTSAFSTPPACATP